MFQQLINLPLFLPVITPNCKVYLPVKHILHDALNNVFLCSRAHSIHWVLNSRRRRIKHVGLHCLCLSLFKLSSAETFKGHHYEIMFAIAAILYLLHMNNTIIQCNINEKQFDNNRLSWICCFLWDEATINKYYGWFVQQLECVKTYLIYMLPEKAFSLINLWNHYQHANYPLLI